MFDGFGSPNRNHCFKNTFKYSDEKLVLEKYSIVEEAQQDHLCLKRPSLCPVGPTLGPIHQKRGENDSDRCSSGGDVRKSLGGNIGKHTPVELTDSVLRGGHDRPRYSSIHRVRTELGDPANRKRYETFAVQGRLRRPNGET